MTEGRVITARKREALVQIEEADRCLQRAVALLRGVDMPVSAEQIHRVRERLGREAARARGAAGFDDQLRSVG